MICLDEGHYEKIIQDKINSKLNWTKVVISSFLREVKPKLGDKLWFSLSPKSNQPESFYGLPKIHKHNIPLRPIVDYTTYPSNQLRKYLAQVLKPFQKEVVSHLSDSYDLVKKLKKLSLDNEETFLSFDVTTAIADCIANINALLHNCTYLSNHTSFEPSAVVKGIDVCLNSTFYTFKNIVHKQTNGVAMVSPVSLIVANLFLHHFESSAIRNMCNPPKTWMRYVDDIFLLLKRDQFSNDQNPQFLIHCTITWK